MNNDNAMQCEGEDTVTLLCITLVHGAFLRLTAFSPVNLPLSSDACFREHYLEPKTCST